MFFEDLTQIKDIATKTGFSIFLIPDKYLTPELNLKTNPTTREKLNLPALTINVEPDHEKQKITVEQIREIENYTRSKQVSDFYILIEKAESMNEAAQNAFLKLLEEPKDHYHFIFISNTLENFLTTVLSRAEVYFIRENDPLGSISITDPIIMNYAKRLLVAKPRDLTQLINDITSDKEYKKTGNSRPFTLKIVATSIELAYKSFYKTRDTKFLKPLPNLLKTYDTISRNGNIKLHLVADMC